jgi:hypothetical protein
MSDLIDALEQDHREILGHLLRIRAADYRRDVSLSELRQARDKFLRHVGRDEQAVFRPLQAHAAHATMGRQSQRQMQALTKEMLAFFDRYDQPEGPAFGIEFAMDLGRLTQRLRHRMQFEEDRLYPLVRGMQTAVHV